MKTHGEGGKALHVGAVDQLLPTHNVGLEKGSERRLVVKVGSTRVREQQSCWYLLIGVLLLQHEGQPLQEGPHTRRHVEADHSLFLQGCATSGQHMVGRHEVFGTIHNQYVLQIQPQIIKWRWMWWIWKH